MLQDRRNVVLLPELAGCNQERSCLSEKARRVAVPRAVTSPVETAWPMRCAASFVGLFGPAVRVDRSRDR